MRAKRLAVLAAAWVGLVGVGLLANPRAEGDCRPPNGTWPLYGSPYASTHLGYCIYVSNYWLNEPGCPPDTRPLWTTVRSRAMQAMTRPYTSPTVTCETAWNYAKDAREHAEQANTHIGNGAPALPSLQACLDALDHLD
jgi:hypothetical protein